MVDIICYFFSTEMFFYENQSTDSLGSGQRTLLNTPRYGRLREMASVKPAVGLWVPTNGSLPMTSLMSPAKVLIVFFFVCCLQNYCFHFFAGCLIKKFEVTLMM
jgi:hypothetical protein